MTFPSFIFGMTVATFLGALFHFWQRGGLGKLLFFLIISNIGFWTGHYIAGFQGWTFGQVGPLKLGPAALISLLFLFLGSWFSKIEIEKKT